MAIRNYLFKFFNRYQNFQAANKFNLLSSLNHNEGVLSEYQTYIKEQEAERCAKNSEAIKLSKLDELERREFEIVANFFKNGGHSNKAINPRDVLYQLDKIQLLRNMKLVEENDGAYDPEKVHFEKLKARALLSEEGAEEELVTYIKDRPYLKKYTGWLDLQEQSRYSYLG